MKKVLTLDSGWQLKRIDSVDELDFSRMNEYLKNGTEKRDMIFAIERMPAQVYEILIAEDVIENPNIQGDSTAC